MKKFFLVVFVLLWACGGTPESTTTQAESEGPEPIAVTQWTERSELFMEYPPLRIGETSRFAIHLTDLRTFQPLTEGQAVVELAYGGGRPETFTEEGPSRPGIFGVNVTPTRAGSPLMTIYVHSPAVEDEHRLGPVDVTGEAEGGDQAHPRDGDEQQGHAHA